MGDLGSTRVGKTDNPRCTKGNGLLDQGHIQVGAAKCLNKLD